MPPFPPADDWMSPPTAKHVELTKEEKLFILANSWDLLILCMDFWYIMQLKTILYNDPNYMYKNVHYKNVNILKTKIRKEH